MQADIQKVDVSRFLQVELGGGDCLLLENNPFLMPDTTSRQIEYRGKKQRL